MAAQIIPFPLGEHGAIATPEQLATLGARARSRAPMDPWRALGNASDKRSAAATLARIGLHPIALHGLEENGSCTCGRPDCDKSRGKHPVAKGWQSGELDPQALDEVLALRWRLNLGLRMGSQPNGWFLIAIDVDGPRELLAPLEAKHGPLPETLTARTGSGGLHLVYRITDPSKVPGNRQKLAPGIDVRSEGGQIVVAPSVHQSRNRYQWVTLRTPEVLF